MGALFGTLFGLIFLVLAAGFGTVCLIALLIKTIKKIFDK